MTDNPTIIPVQERHRFDTDRLGAWMRDHVPGYAGPLSVEQFGGGLSSNHPGMRGMFLVIEAVKQLRGECGDRQVKDAEIALCHGTGGWLGLRHSGATLILGRA